jgi:hypothetical protein
MRSTCFAGSVLQVQHSRFQNGYSPSGRNRWWQRLKGWQSDEINRCHYRDQPYCVFGCGAEIPIETSILVSPSTGRHEGRSETDQDHPDPEISCQFLAQKQPRSQSEKHAV